jgi:hypothetical protein
MLTRDFSHFGISSLLPGRNCTPTRRRMEALFQPHFSPACDATDSLATGSSGRARQVR